MRRYDAVLFDMGGTLVHAPRPVTDLWAAALGLGGLAEGLAAADVTAPQRQTADEHRAQWSAIYRRLLDAYDGDVDEAVALMWEIWIHRTWRAFADVAGAVDALRSRGCALGIVSNWTPTLRATCEGLGFDQWADAIVCSSDAGYAKPDPRIFDAALSALGVKARRALYVGDHYGHDVMGARGAGMDAFWVRRDRGRGLAGVPEGV